MFTYNLRLAISSFRQSPILTGLIIVALGLGIGLSMTIITMYYSMAANPIPEKSNELFAVRIDNWSVGNSYNDDPTQPPSQISYTDAVALLESDIPARQVAMFKATFVIDRESEAVAPFYAVARVAGRDFFPLFNVPFLYGGPWSQNSENNAEYVVVLDKVTNDRVFGGENSVGRRLKLGSSTSSRHFTVVGVLDDWNPVPKFYDLNNGAIDTGENLFVPFSLAAAIELDRSGNTLCWKGERVRSYQERLSSECLWLQYWVELNDQRTLEDYRQWLDAYVMEQKKLGRFEKPLNNRVDAVMTWLEINKVVPTEVNILIGLALLFLTVCIFNAISLLLSRFFRKAPLIGVRRALGASKWDIFKAHLLEVACIGLLGGILGLGLTWLGLLGLRSLITNFSPEQITQLNWDLVVITLLLAIGSAIVAGLYPAWRISQISPAHYLKTQ